MADRPVAPTLHWAPADKHHQASLLFWEKITMAHANSEETLKQVKEVANNPRFDLSTVKTQRLPEMLYFLSLSAEGRKLLEDFLPLYWSKKVEFSVQPRKSNSDAEGHFNENKIYVNWNRPLVEVSTIAAHEMAHAVYELVRKEGIDRVEQIKKLKEKIESENKALQAQINEGQKDPKKLDQKRLQAKLLEFQKLTQEGIAVGAERLIQSEHYAYTIQDKINSEFSAEIEGVREQVLQIYFRAGLHSFPINEDTFRGVLRGRVALSALDAYFKKVPWNYFE